jgi:hypothetical protein
MKRISLAIAGLLLCLALALGVVAERPIARAAALQSGVFSVTFREGANRTECPIHFEADFPEAPIVLLSLDASPWAASTAPNGESALALYAHTMTPGGFALVLDLGPYEKAGDATYDVRWVAIGSDSDNAAR